MSKQKLAVKLTDSFNFFKLEKHIIKLRLQIQ